jgi:hypothetical protein
MGLFDWFRRRKPQKQLQQQGRRGFEQELERKLEENGPRPQYYYFAHYALRDATFELGAACGGVLMSPRKDELLGDLWEHITQGIREQDPKAPLDPLPSVEVMPLVAGRTPCVVLKFPPPKGITECHFVGMVLHFDPSKGESPNEQTKVSYFTLEHGENDAGGPRTVLCEWTKEGSNLNYGDGPPAEPELFANAIGQKLAGRGYEVEASFTPPGDS